MFYRLRIKYSLLIERSKAWKNLNSLKRPFKSRQDKDTYEPSEEEMGFVGQIEEINKKLDWMENYWLRQKARRLHISFPPYEDKNIWIDPDEYGNYLLTKNGVAYINTEIKKVKNKRQDRALKWLVGLTGLIGTLTGLAAVILSK